MSNWETRCAALTHGDLIKKLFGLLFEDWMDDSNKEDFVKEMEAKMETSLEDLDKKIQVGVDNGYSVETQEKIIKAFFVSIKAITNTKGR